LPSLLVRFKAGQSGLQGDAVTGERIQDMRRLMHGCRAAEVFPTEQFKTMRAKCISQELSWKAPAKKW